MKIVVGRRDAPDRPPTPWVPPYVSPSPIPLSELELPTSLWKGEGWMGGVCFLSMLRSVDLGPYPSREGRGHLLGCRGWLRANRGGESEGKWW